MGKFHLRSKGGPTMATTKSHGTNANYKKSGMNNADGSAVTGEGAPFLGKLLKNPFGGMKGKRPMWKKLLDPAGIFKKKGGGNTNQGGGNTNQQVDQSVADTGVNTDAPVDQTVDTNAPVGSEGAAVPNQEELGTN